VGIVRDFRLTRLKDTLSNSCALFRVSCHAMRVNEVNPKLFKSVWLVSIDSLNLVIAKIADLPEGPEELSWCESINFKHLSLCSFT
jgi:hypothetical protein